MLVFILFSSVVAKPKQTSGIHAVVWHRLRKWIFVFNFSQFFFFIFSFRTLEILCFLSSRKPEVKKLKTSFWYFQKQDIWKMISENKFLKIGCQIRCRLHFHLLWKREEKTRFKNIPNGIIIFACVFLWLSSVGNVHVDSLVPVLNSNVRNTRQIVLMKNL